MKKKIKKSLSLLLAVVLLLTAAPLASLSDLDLSGVADWFSTTAKAYYTEGYLNYEVEDGEATITGCDRSISGELVIPSTLGGYPVTSIGNYAFSGCTGLTKINWNAENVRGFGEYNYVFSNVGTAGEGIDVVFGDNVKSIPAYLFYSDETYYKTPNIKSVTIGNSVTSINWFAFYNCTGLTKNQLERRKR